MLPSNDTTFPDCVPCSVNGNDDEEEGEEEDIIGRQESKGGEAQQTSDRDVKLLASLKDHSKYLVACRWAPDGGAFVTASHDKVVTLYVRQGSGGGGGKGVGGTGYEQVIAHDIVILTYGNDHRDEGSRFSLSSHKSVAERSWSPITPQSVVERNAHPVIPTAAAGQNYASVLGNSHRWTRFEVE